MYGSDHQIIFCNFVVCKSNNASKHPMTKTSFIWVSLLVILLTGCQSTCQYKPYQFDNGDDYFCEGGQRIVDREGRIGFRDSLGNITITPQFAFAFPFSGGYAKVTYTGHSEPVKPGSEYHHWISDSWQFIDHTGKTFPNLVEISGRIYDQSDGSPLSNAFVNNSEADKTILSDENGYFRVFANNGDTVRISYVGMIEKTIPVNASDSTRWEIGLNPIPAIVEPPLQKSYSTNKNLKMAVVSPYAFRMPVDSIVVEFTNNADKEAMYGEWYRLERLDGDKWIEAPANASLKNQNGEILAIVFSAVGYILPAHESRKYANPSSAYNKNITAGRYRLSKTFSYPPYPTEKSDTAYVEFVIP